MPNDNIFQTLIKYPAPNLQKEVKSAIKSFSIEYFPLEL